LGSDTQFAEQLTKGIVSTGTRPCALRCRLRCAWQVCYSPAKRVAAEKSRTHRRARGGMDF